GRAITAGSHTGRDERDGLRHAGSNYLGLVLRLELVFLRVGGGNCPGGTLRTGIARPGLVPVLDRGPAAHADDAVRLYYLIVPTLDKTAPLPGLFRDVSEKHSSHAFAMSRQ